MTFRIRQPRTFKAGPKLAVIAFAAAGLTCQTAHAIHIDVASTNATFISADPELSGIVSATDTGSLLLVIQDAVADQSTNTMFGDYNRNTFVQFTTDAGLDLVAREGDMNVNNTFPLLNESVEFVQSSTSTHSDNLFGTDLSFTGYRITFLGRTGTNPLADDTIATAINALDNASTTFFSGSLVAVFEDTANNTYEASFALDLSNTGVTDIPEPTSLGIIAMGGLGLMTRRRRPVD